MKLLWGEARPQDGENELSDGDLLMVIAVLAIAALVIGLELSPELRAFLHGTLIGNRGWATPPFGALLPDWWPIFWDPFGWMRN